jgi:hypothetical protein
METATAPEIISLIKSVSNLMPIADDLVVYVKTMQPGSGLSRAQLDAGFKAFVLQRRSDFLADLALRHQVDAAGLREFCARVLELRAIDGDKLTDLFIKHDVPWRQRVCAERGLLGDLAEYLSANGPITGLKDYLRG